MKQLPRQRVHTWSNLFCKAKTLETLCSLLDVSSTNLKGMAYLPNYQEIHLPKKAGGIRLIENPEPTLKSLQQSLNFYLQCTYHFCRTDAVYGFVMGASGDPLPRNILTNAQRHIGNEYMINIDFSNFFHCINYEAVVEIFKNTPFGFEDDLAHWLAKLTTYRQRLPMGAPTSPVLSNFACMNLDFDLLQLAHEKQWTYTRYVDDLTFSGANFFELSDIEAVRTICEMHGFVINEDKLTKYRADQTKIVTGLWITGSRVQLPDQYVEQVSSEIVKLKHVSELRYRMGQNSIPWLKHFKQQIKGAIKFVTFVLGDESPEVRRLEYELANALNPPNLHDPVSWLEFGYHYS